MWNMAGRTASPTMNASRPERVQQMAARENREDASLTDTLSRLVWRPMPIEPNEGGAEHGEPLQISATFAIAGG